MKKKTFIAAVLLGVFTFCASGCQGTAQDGAQADKSAGSAAEASAVQEPEKNGAQADADGSQSQEQAVSSDNPDDIGMELPETVVGEVPAEEPAAEPAGEPEASGEPVPLPEPVSLRFVCVGDNLIHGSIIDFGLAMGGDWNYMYENIAYYIQSFDVAVLNQETPLVSDPADYSGYPNFGTPYGVADATVNAGFDIFTCATNHALDQWIYGVNCTIGYYDSLGLFHVGTQSTEQLEYMPYGIYEQNGIRCAILNYTYGTNGIPLPEEYPYMVHLLNDENRIREDIALAKQDADVVLVFAHWGDEYSVYVSDAQRYWTQVFYESGADVVVGAHPHVLEPFEMISDGAGHDMLVYYSLGNFVSSQTDEPDIVGGAATFTITKQGDNCWVSEYGLDALVTHQSGSMRSQVFRLPDYDDYLCSLHWMDLSMEKLWAMFFSYTSW